MAKYSKIRYVNPVESVSRKFARRADKIGKIVNVWMGGATQQRYVVGLGHITKNVFVVRKYARTSAPTTDELKIRSNFSAASKWAAAALKDLLAINANQMKWIAAMEDTSKTIEGVSALGYEGPRGWIVAIAYALLDAGQTLPVDHILPDFDD